MTLADTSRSTQKAVPDILLLPDLSAQPRVSVGPMPAATRQVEWAHTGRGLAVDNRFGKEYCAARQEHPAQAEPPVREG